MFNSFHFTCLTENNNQSIGTFFSQRVVGKILKNRLRNLFNIILAKNPV